LRRHVASKRPLTVNGLLSATFQELGLGCGIDIATYAKCSPIYVLMHSAILCRYLRLRDGVVSSPSSVHLVQTIPEAEPSVRCKEFCERLGFSDTFFFLRTENSALSYGLGLNQSLR
jgi:hypothetical protein